MNFNSPPPRPASHRDAAVLVPVYRDAAGALRVVLVRRTEGGIHGAQLAFPGGAREAGDRFPHETALREAREEIGLEEDAAETLAVLPVVDTWVSGFLVTPILARIRPPERWRLDAREIAGVLEPSLEELSRPEAHDVVVETFPDWPAPVRVSFYRVGPYRLWGASYRIFHPLLPRLLAGEWML